MMITDFDNSRLNTLWTHRHRLNSQEWNELYTLVGGILSRCSFPELANLPDELAVYMADFFSRKVYEPTVSHRSQPDGATEPAYSAGYIRQAFRNFLIDQLRWQNTHQTVSLDIQEDEGGEVIPEPCGCEDVDIDLLEENGLSQQAIEKSASVWLTRQEPWVLLYLGLQYCPDKDQGIPLADLAQRLAIPSYHHKARKLGLSRRKTDRSVAWFRDTLLGQWLENDLAVRIEPDNFDLIEAVLKVLCVVSLNQVTVVQNPVARIVNSV